MAIRGRKVSRALKVSPARKDHKVNKVQRALPGRPALKALKVNLAHKALKVCKASKARKVRPDPKVRKALQGLTAMMACIAGISTATASLIPKKTSTTTMRGTRWIAKDRRDRKV